MPREILVATPENIEIEYELGGVGSRLIANLVDSLLQTLIFVCVIIAFTLIGFLLSFVHRGWAAGVISFFSDILTAAISLVFFLVLWGYFIWFEIKWNGQTPGKRQQGLRVLQTSGAPVSASAVIIRNLLRVIDGMPLVTLVLIGAGIADNGSSSVVGAIGGASILLTLGFILFSALSQRLGDFLAGTMVVKQRAPRIPTLEALAPPPRMLPERLAAFALEDIARHVYDMTVPEYRAVRHAIDRRWQLPLPVQQSSAMHLASPLMQRLGIAPPEGVTAINYADLLEYLAVAFEQYRGVK